MKNYTYLYGRNIKSMGFFENIGGVYIDNRVLWAEYHKYSNFTYNIDNYLDRTFIYAPSTKNLTLIQPGSKKIIYDGSPIVFKIVENNDDYRCEKCAFYKESRCILREDFVQVRRSVTTVENFNEINNTMNDACVIPYKNKYPIYRFEKVE